MVRRRTVTRANGGETRGARATLSGGEGLKRAIHVARARAGFTSDMQLSIRAGVSYDTFMNWFGDKTTPRPAEVKKVADVLGVRLDDLMSAWEGRPREPVELHVAIRELVDELRLMRIQQHEATIAILQALGAALPPAPAPRETRSSTPRERRPDRPQGPSRA